MDRSVKVWDIESGEVEACFEGHLDAVYCVDFSPVDDNLLVSGSLDRTVRLWRVSDGACVKVLSGHGDFVLSVVFTPDGQQVISAGKDRNCLVWNASTFDSVLTLTGHSNSGIPIANICSYLLGGKGGHVADWVWG